MIVALILIESGTLSINHSFYSIYLSCNRSHSSLVKFVQPVTFLCRN